MGNEINWESWANGTLEQEPKQTWREREALSRKIGSALFPFCKDLDLSGVREMHKLLKMIVEIDDNINTISKALKSSDPSVIKAVENLTIRVKSQMAELYEEEDYISGNLLDTRMTIAALADRLNGTVKALDFLINSFEILK